MNYLKEELFTLIKSDQRIFDFVLESGLWSWDLSRPEHQWMSPHFWTLLGYDSVPDRLPEAFIHPQDEYLARHFADAHLADSQAPCQAVIRYFHHSGSLVWIRMKGLAIRNAEGHLFRLLITFSDITKEKQAELAAQHEAALYTYIAASGLLYLVKTNEQGQYRFLNESFCQDFGLDPQADLGRSLLEDVVKKDHDKAQALLASNQWPTAAPQAMRLRQTGSSGDIRSIEWLLMGPTSSAHEFLLIGRDLTQNHKVERDFSLLIANMSDVLTTITAEGILTYASASWTNVYGYSLQETLGQSVASFVHPDDLAACMEALTLTLSTNTVQPGVEHRIRHKNGSWCWAITTAGLNELGGEIILTSHDITDRKAAEVELHHTRQLLEQTSQMAQVGGWEYNPDRQELFMSEVTRQIYELPAHTPVNLPEALALLGWHKGQLKRRVLRALRKGQPWDEEIQIKTAQGQPKWIRTLGHAEIVDGRCQRFYGSVQDVDERKKAETKIVQAQQQALAASRAKSEFLANMSHEIRTPLNGVVGFSELLLKTPLEETQQQYVKLVVQSAQSLLDIINDILDFSKIEAGHLELSPESIDLPELASQVTDLILFPAHQKNIEVLLDLSSDVARFIQADGVRLRQVLVNLLSNAMKFTHEGEIELKVQSLGLQASGLTRFRFSVRDTGIGIHPDQHERIFEAFAQADASTTRRFGGTGLGLSISTKLLALMKSQLTLESTPGQGSMFSFEIDFPVLSEGPGITRDLQHLKQVLIVDDNATNRRIVTDMLALQHIACQHASSGEEALERLQEDTCFDVVLMDYHMPELDGLQTIRRMRQELHLSGQQQPVIMLCSSSDDPLLNEAMRPLDIDARLLKPIKMQQLYQALARLQQPVHVSDQPSASTTILSEQPLKLLIAEDNAVNMLLAKTILKRSFPQATLLEATTGRQAIEQFIRHQPDLIFMDVQMPELNGYEATMEIRKLETHQRTPILALTASAVLGERERCLEAGMDDYLIKPIVKAALLSALQRWLDPKPA